MKNAIASKLLHIMKEFAKTRIFDTLQNFFRKITDKPNKVLINLYRSLPVYSIYQTFKHFFIFLLNSQKSCNLSLFRQKLSSEMLSVAIGKSNQNRVTIWHKSNSINQIASQLQVWRLLRRSKVTENLF